MANNPDYYGNISAATIPGKCSLFRRLIEIKDENNDHSKRAGSENGRKARKAICSAIESSTILSRNAHIRLETFEFDSVEPIQQKAKLIFDNQEMFGVHLYDNTGYKEGYSGEQLSTRPKKLLYVKKRLNVFQSKNARDKIVAFDLAEISPHRTEQVYSALKAGAAGVILVAQGNLEKTGIGYPYAGFACKEFPDLSHFKHCNIPVIGLLRDQWTEISGHEIKEIAIQYGFRQETLAGANIIVDLGRKYNDKAPGKIIVLGAHYDGWEIGAQDNCASVQTLFSVLEELFRYKNSAPKHPVRAIFWDAEELGLLGSIYHISNRDIQNLIQSYKFYFNFEMCLPTTLKFFNNFLLYNYLKPERFAHFNRIHFGIFRLITRILGSRGFPSDVEVFLRKNISSATTACLNEFYHTKLDDGRNIEWKLYDKVVEWITKYIKRIDASL
ncbi:MAG: M28 family peptidase [Thermodesulfobacteriota bacterium]